jgi:hypothetical protein
LPLVADLQWSPPTVNGEIDKVLRGAHSRASSPFGYEHEHPGRQSVFLSIYRNDSRPRDSQDDHLDLIVHVFSNTLSSTKPHQVSVQIAARIQGPDHSGAVASGRGYVFEVHFNSLGLPSPRLPLPIATFRRQTASPRASTEWRTPALHASSIPASASTFSSAVENLIRPSWTLSVIGPRARSAHRAGHPPS